MDAARTHLTAAGVEPDVANELAALFVSTVEGMFVLSRTQRDTAPLRAAGRHVAALVERATSDAAPSRT